MEPLWKLLCLTALRWSLPPALWHFPKSRSTSVLGRCCRWPVRPGDSALSRAPSCPPRVRAAARPSPARTVPRVPLPAWGRGPAELTPPVSQLLVPGGEQRRPHSQERLSLPPPPAWPRPRRPLGRAPLPPPPNPLPSGAWPSCGFPAATRRLPVPLGDLPPPAAPAQTVGTRLSHESAALRWEVPTHTHAASTAHGLSRGRLTWVWTRALQGCAQTVRTPSSSGSWRSERSRT